MLHICVYKHIDFEKFIYLLNKYVFFTYCVLTAFVGAIDTGIRLAKFPVHGTHILVTVNKYGYIFTA